MRLLFITEHFPSPLNSGGKIRTHNVLKLLGEEHEITMLCCTDSSTELISEYKIRGICQNILAVPLKKNWLREVKGLQIGIRRGIPHLIARHYVQAIADAVRKLDLSRFDAVHFDHLDATVYYSLLPKGVRTFLDEHNIVTIQMKSSLKSIKSPLIKFYIKYQLNKVSEFESEMAGKMERCFVCSEEDKKRLQDTCPRAVISVAPNGVDLDYFGPSGRDKHSRKAIVFVGSMDYLPNIAGVEWFYENVWPEIKKYFPTLKFYVVGKNPPLTLRRRLSADLNIKIIGGVSDVRPYYYKSLASIVPLLSGSGTRLKILEAMACGTPVISTIIGAEGLNAVQSEHLLIADEPVEFAAKILELIENQNKRDMLIDRALSLVRSEYSWRTTLSPIKKAYAK